MRYLVTGGCGFLGRVLIDQSCERGDEVLVADRLPGTNLPEGVVAYNVDLRDRAGLSRVLSENKPLDGVFDLAAILAHVRSDRRTIWETNVEGTANLLHACQEAGAPKIVFTSANCVFAEGFAEPVKEEQLPCPIEHYGASKVEGEKLFAENGSRVPYVLLNLRFFARRDDFHSNAARER